MNIYYKTYPSDLYSRITDNEKQMAKQIRNDLLDYAFLSFTGKHFNEYQITYNRYGKPEAGDKIHFNISHTRGFVCCAVNYDGPVGVDAEYVRDINIDLLNKICSQNEKESILSSVDIKAEFIKYWTLKESYIKMIGMGLAFPLKNINFSFDNNTIYSNANDAFFDIMNIDKYTIALCTQKQVSVVNIEEANI